MYSKSPSTPSARTNASQKVVSRKYCACTCNARSAMRSLGYPPSMSLSMASWIVIATSFTSPASHFETRVREMRDCGAVPCTGCTGDVGPSQLGALQIRLQLLHFVPHLGKVFRQFLLRQGEHFRFFFLDMMGYVADQFLKLRVELIRIMRHAPQFLHE